MTAWGKRKDGQAYPKTKRSGTKRSGSITASGSNLKTKIPQGLSETTKEKTYNELIKLRSLQNQILEEFMANRFKTQSNLVQLTNEIEIRLNILQSSNDPKYLDENGSIKFNQTYPTVDNVMEHDPHLLGYELEQSKFEEILQKQSAFRFREEKNIG